MSKSVMVICTSLREGGNSEMLADEFIRGARESGNDVEKITLYGKTISFCQGCLICQDTGVCAIKDDAQMITEKMKIADCIVFATPIYYYEMCGQMKTILDRANPLYSLDYKFRDVYLLMTAADSDGSAMDGAIKGLEGWIACFDKAVLKGVIKGLGVVDIDDIKGNSALYDAYEMGKNV